MDGKFSAVSIELIGKCNSSCEFCPYGYTRDFELTNIFTNEKIKRTKEKITISFLEELFEFHPIRSIVCSGLMEPFLAPDIIFYLLKHAEERQQRLSIFTNASLLTHNIIDRLLSHERLNMINFSLNAVTDETRQKVMKLPLEPAESNVKYFFQEYGKIKANRERQLHLGVSMILTPNNRQEESQFRQIWNNEFTKIGLEPNVGVFYGGNWNGAITNYCMKIVATTNAICRQWAVTAPQITPDGYMYMCCYTPYWITGHVLNRDDAIRHEKRREILNIGDLACSTEYPIYCNGCAAREAVVWKQ